VWEQAGQDVCGGGEPDIDHERSLDAAQISSVEGSNRGQKAYHGHWEKADGPGQESSLNRRAL
jgi:hypothetical protein